MKRIRKIKRRLLWRWLQRGTRGINQQIYYTVIHNDDDNTHIPNRESKMKKTTNKRKNIIIYTIPCGVTTSSKHRSPIKRNACAVQSDLFYWQWLIHAFKRQRNVMPARKERRKKNTNKSANVTNVYWLFLDIFTYAEEGSRATKCAHQSLPNRFQLI